MINIKEELSEKLKQNQKNNEKRARAFIEGWLIPRFREIAENFPLESELWILITRKQKMWYCEDNRIKNEEMVNFDYNVIYKATQICDEYGIESSVATTEETESYGFSLKLE